MRKKREYIISRPYNPHIIYCSLVNTELGDVLITANDKDLISVQFDPPKIKAEENEITIKAKKELEEYFAGKRKKFSDFNYHLPSFTGRVLKVVKEIPYGETISYKELAKRVGNADLVRAAAAALSQNYYLIFIPCHRVIGSDNKLHGYQAGLKRKRFLLELEKKYSQEESQQQEKNSK